jgi:glutathione-regulated potassium-efflux system ancillary protein KefG
MARVLVLFAHPRLEKSRVNRSLLARFPQHPDITFRDLYELYPDFNVDKDAEQQLLMDHDIIVWHHPLYWYSAPPLLKQWIDIVLAFGWAYGPGGDKLKGKHVFQVITSGGGAEAYSKEGFHGFTIEEFLRPFQRTITLCGMFHLPPFAVHGSNRIGDAELERHAHQYAALLTGLATDQIEPASLKGHSLLNQAMAHSI